MSRLNVGRYEQMAARAFDVKGPGALTEIEDSIFGTLALDEDSPLPYRFLQGIREYAGGDAQAAVAAQYSWIQFWNPQDSSRLICIDRILQTSPVLQRQATYVTDGTVTGSASGGWKAPRDLRMAITEDPILDTRAGSSAVATFGNLIAELPARGDIPFPIVLTPGRGLALRPFGVNLENRLTAVFRERHFESSEQ